MKKINLLLAILLSSNVILAQIEKPNYKIVVDKFEAFYNAEKYDSIFVMFDSNMQNFMNLEKTRSFLGGVTNSFGKMSTKKFRKYKSTVAIYRINYEKIPALMSISIDNEQRINGLTIIPLPKEISRTTSILKLPFKDEWTITWGGDTKELNYHVESDAQKNAFDFLITNNKGNSFKTNGKTNEDYYAFGKELMAPCDGEIMLVVDGIKDNIVGEGNTFHTGGNTVILKSPTNEYLVFCHFKQNSIVIKQGQKMKQGQLLGLCGNSGNSSEPHLHFHIQNVEDMNYATGVKCYFDKLMVNGVLKNDYSPIKNEKIKSE